MKLPEGIESAVISGLDEFLKALKEGSPIKGTRVTREETPDGPLHTFEEVELVLKNEE